MNYAQLSCASVLPNYLKGRPHRIIYCRGRNPVPRSPVPLAPFSPPLTKAVLWTTPCRKKEHFPPPQMERRNWGRDSSFLVACRPSTASSSSQLTCEETIKGIQYILLVHSIQLLKLNLWLQRSEKSRLPKVVPNAGVGVVTLVWQGPAASQANITEIPDKLMKHSELVFWKYVHRPEWRIKVKLI